MQQIVVVPVNRLELAPRLRLELFQAVLEGHLHLREHALRSRLRQ